MLIPVNDDGRPKPRPSYSSESSRCYLSARTVIFDSSEIDRGGLSHIEMVTLDQHHRTHERVGKITVAISSSAFWITMDYDGLGLYQRPGFLSIPTLVSLSLLPSALQEPVNVPRQVMPSGSRRRHRPRQPPTLLQAPSSKDLP